MKSSRILTMIRALRPSTPKSVMVLCVVFSAACARQAEIAKAPEAPEDVIIIRDDFGTPHIHAKTDEGASFGLGYSEAEDRLEELLKNYRRAEGTMAEAFGKDHVREDYLSRLWRHREVSEANYSKLTLKTRRCIEAYIAGVKEFMKQHPEQVPAWAQPVQPWQVVALGRYIIWGWPLGDAFEDLERGGIEPDPLPYRGSNEWLIAPQRTAEGAVIALIDPHLSWYDQFRFYECRLYGEKLKISGMGILGASLPALGHSQWCSIAMTTGSGDTADVFEETVNPDNPLQYQVDGKWLDMKVKHEKIRVKKGEKEYDELQVDMAYTNHGPIVARKGGKAYAIAIPYSESVGLPDQVYDMMTAKNLGEMQEALAELELMGQNVMIGTVDGDIYYQRTGKVPIRGKGVDPTKPIPGNISANDWKGVHKPEELVQVKNPPQGYMQNCNVSPFAMMKNSPLRLKDYPAYVYGAEETPPHQRAAMVVELLDAGNKVTVDQAIDIAINYGVFGAEKWQEQLKAAVEKKPIDPKEHADAQKLYSLIMNWDRQSGPGSTGAVAYKYWKDAIPEKARAGDGMGAPPPESLTDEEMIAALDAAAKNLRTEHGSLDIPYGKIYRCGRREADGSYARTFPVGGGNPGDGMATPRAIGFRKDASGAYVGQGGQTSTQIVLLTKPPKSWTVLPLGESDHKESGHWDDQAEKLFSHGQMKPTYFMDEIGLREHIASTSVITFRSEQTK